MFNVPSLNLNNLRKNLEAIKINTPSIPWENAGSLLKKIPSSDEILSKFGSKPKKHQIPKDDIVEMFINIIQVEDEEENPQETFYNHPQRVNQNIIFIL